MLRNLKTNWTATPALFRLLFTLIKKHPSPGWNPAIHSWESNYALGTKGRIIGIVLGKAVFKTSDSPKFNEARILIIDWRPTSYRCSPLIINIILYLNRKYSACFLVIKKYF